MWLLVGDVVARWSCGCFLEMWLLIGNVVACRSGCSSQMWLPVGDVVAQWNLVALVVDDVACW